MYINDASWVTYVTRIVTSLTVHDGSDITYVALMLIVNQEYHLLLNQIKKFWWLNLN